MTPVRAQRSARVTIERPAWRWRPNGRSSRRSAAAASCRSGALRYTRETSSRCTPSFYRPTDRRAIRARRTGTAEQPDALGRRVADELVAAGALEILDEVRRSTMNTPCVYLVGAGPGDPGPHQPARPALLQAADVIIYDHRVHARLLRSGAARRRADRRRRARRRSRSIRTPSASSSPRRPARAGPSARLKWGDPFVFDSGGKEALFLHEQGIPFEVVPGIPARSAGWPTPACRSPIRRPAT